MTPGPSLQEMIATVRADAAGDDDLEQLATASRAVADLEAVSDATLGHFVDQCRRNGRSWSDISKALGVTKQAAHKRFSFATLNLARFTPRARAAVRAAADEAHRLGHDNIGPEHLLLGMFAPAEGIAAQILDEAGITHADVEQRILDGAARASSLAEAEPPFAPGAIECVERAGAEARRLGHNYVGTEHLLLALFGDSDSLTASILTELGATYDYFRDRVIERLGGSTPPKP
jgi:hypothetical protein